MINNYNMKETKIKSSNLQNRICIKNGYLGESTYTMSTIHKVAFRNLRNILCMFLTATPVMRIQERGSLFSKLRRKLSRPSRCC